jgi:hypothetical protein
MEAKGKVAKVLRTFMSRGNKCIRDQIMLTDEQKLVETYVQF